MRSNNFFLSGDQQQLVEYNFNRPSKNSNDMEDNRTVDGLDMADHKNDIVSTTHLLGNFF